MIFRGWKILNSKLWRDKMCLYWQTITFILRLLYLHFWVGTINHFVCRKNDENWRIELRFPARLFCHFSTERMIFFACTGMFFRYFKTHRGNRWYSTFSVILSFSISLFVVSINSFFFVNFLIFQIISCPILLQDP